MKSQLVIGAFQLCGRDMCLLTRESFLSLVPPSFGAGDILFNHLQMLLQQNDRGERLQPDLLHSPANFSEPLLLTELCPAQPRAAATFFPAAGAHSHHSHSSGASARSTGQQQQQQQGIANLSFPRVRTCFARAPTTRLQLTP